MSSSEDRLFCLIGLPCFEVLDFDVSFLWCRAMVISIPIRGDKRGKATKSRTRRDGREIQHGGKHRCCSVVKSEFHGRC